MIPYGKQNISSQDIASVVNVLESRYLTQGPAVPEFEKAICNYCNADYAVAVNSATSALHLACLALGVGLGDCVWTSPISFVASANCARFCQATIDFVDVDPDSGLMCVKSLSEKLLQAELNGTLPKVIIPVHYSGQSCDMESIFELSKKYGFKIIEDASHALGGSYLDEKVGCCRHSDISVFSFHPVKMLTTGEGGAVLCNSQELYEKVKRLRSHGIDKTINDEPWGYEQLELGYNYRMSDMAATLGISQLSRLNLFLKKRRTIATKYNEAINNSLIVPITQGNKRKSSYHLYPVLTKDSKHRRSLYEFMHSRGVAVQVHYIPIYRQPYYKNMGLSSMEGSEAFYNRVISLPVFYDLQSSELNWIIQSVNEFKGGCSEQ